MRLLDPVAPLRRCSYSTCQNPTRDLVCPHCAELHRFYLSLARRLGLLRRGTP